MNNSYKEVTVVVVSHKSKKKVLDLLKNISNNFKIIIVENSHDKSIENPILFGLFREKRDWKKLLIFGLKKFIKLTLIQNFTYSA